jgi:hypothetical protein
MADDGLDWRGLLELTAPLIGAFATHGPSQTGFLQGWQQGQSLAQQHLRERQQADEQKRKQSADYLLRIGEHAQGMDDPVALDEFLRLAEDAGTKAGYTKAGDLRGRFTVSPNKLADARLKELTDQLDSLGKNYDLDQLAQSGATLTLRNGTHVPIASALDLTRQRPYDATGKAIPKPKAAEKVGNTEEERFLAKRAKDYGYDALDSVDADTQLQWRSEFRDAGRAAPTDKAYPPGGVDSQFNDLVDLWKEQHPGKEPPIAVRTMLRAQANRVNDKPAAADAAAKLDEGGLDYAATQFRITGQMPALGQRSNEDRAAIINRAASQTKALSLTPAAVFQQQAARKGDVAALGKLKTMSAAAESFENKALAQADMIDALSSKVSRTQYPAINAALQSGRVTLLGDTNAQQLANAVQTFTAEYAKIIEGSTGSAAGSSDSARRAAERLLNTAMSKGTMRDVLALMRREMALTVQGYGATINHITTQMGGVVPPRDEQGTTGSAPIKVGGFTVVVK